MGDFLGACLRSEVSCLLFSFRLLSFSLFLFLLPFTLILLPFRCRQINLSHLFFSPLLLLFSSPSLFSLYFPCSTSPIFQISDSSHVRCTPFSPINFLNECSPIRCSEFGVESYVLHLHVSVCAATDLSSSFFFRFSLATVLLGNSLPSVKLMVLNGVLYGFGIWMMESSRWDLVSRLLVAVSSTFLCHSAGIAIELDLLWCSCVGWIWVFFRFPIPSCVSSLCHLGCRHVALSSFRGFDTWMGCLSCFVFILLLWVV